MRVLDTGEPVEERPLRRVRLPDGRPGVLWGGQAFPLAEDGSIDIAGPFFAPEVCRPWSETSPKRRWTLFGGFEEAVLLLDGDALARDSALCALRSAGLEVLRAAPVLDPELEADWSVRLTVPRDGPPLAARIEAVLGPSSPPSGPTATGDRLRMRLLEEQVRRLLAERDNLRRDLEEARKFDRAPHRVTFEELDGELRRARQRIAELEVELERAHEETASLRQVLEDARAPSVPVVAPSAERIHRRLRAELLAFFEALPRIELVGESLLALLTDYRERKAVYRVLGELQAGDALQRRFKPVRGRDGWYECHVSTGQDDSGRIYVHRVGERWRVLVSKKEDQKRDLERLGALARREA
ncbi:MAG: hypothetical protein K6T74_12080 [Geminicoccaceae bacterium]|nr:hypothetical protein [Geminicoccaceae bacterium]